jgi:acyl-CoA thioesterase-1
MTTALVYHFASGQAYFSGIALIWLAVWLAWRRAGRWWSLGRTVLALTGLIFIAGSATPAPPWFTMLASMISVAWIGFEGTTSDRFRSLRVGLRLAVVAVWFLGACLELPFHRMPTVEVRGNPVVYVIGDSISAGVGGEPTTWPKLLADRSGLPVVDLSVAGADVSKALKQARKVIEPGSIVIAEIGGNDVLGSTTPEAFERDLDVLLSRLGGDGRTVLLLELPLPPTYNRFGEVQRRLAGGHHAWLMPKRLLMGVLTSGGATLDSIHLSQAGHARMAERISEILRPSSRALPADR